MVPGILYLRVRWPRREANHSPPSSAEIKKCAELYLHSPICHHGVVLSYAQGQVYLFQPWREETIWITSRQEDNIKMNLREIGWNEVDWVHVIQNRDQWWALVCRHQWASGFRNIRRIFWPAEWLSASEELLCSTWISINCVEIIIIIIRSIWWRSSSSSLSSTSK